MIKAYNITKLIAIILLVSVILRFCFVLFHLNHDCTHDDYCPICTLIDKFNDDLYGLAPTIIKIVMVGIMIPIIITYLNNIIRNKTKYTLVGLKVELIN